MGVDWTIDDPEPLSEFPLLTKEAERYLDDAPEHAGMFVECLWIQKNIDNDRPDPFSCPSRGAWTLWVHARQRDKTWFYEKFYIPACKEFNKERAKSDEQKVTQQEKFCRDELDRMLAEAIEECQSQS